MKRFNKIALLVLFFAASTTTYSRNNSSINPSQDFIKSDKQEFSKAYNKTFDLSKNTLVILANKYGKVDVKTGSGSQAIVNVKITVHSNSQSEADKVFDRINIAFSNGPDFVKAETDIESQSGSWFNWGNNSSEYSIDYDVTMPAANKLDVSNKYGNCNIGLLNDWVKIDQKYGDFKLEGAGSATVSLAYGGGNIGKMNGLTANVSYGKLSSTDIRDVSLKSKYSEFRFDKIVNLAIVSAYDDYELNAVTNFSIDSKYGDMSIGSVENLAAIGAYTDFKIKKIETSADFQTSYGDVKIGSVKNGFGVINIKSSYTDYSLTIDPSVNYLLDAKTSYSDVNRPASFKYTIDNEKGSTKEIVGYVGSSSAKSMIKARMTYGDLRIK